MAADPNFSVQEIDVTIAENPSHRPSRESDAQNNLKIVCINDNNQNLSQDLEALLSPLLSRLVVLATKTGCSAEALIIVSMQTILTKLYPEPELDNKLDMALSKFRVVESDHLTLLSMYKSWESHKFSSSWCAKNCIQYADMVKVLEFQSQLTAILWRHKILLVSCGIHWLVVLKCISVTYFRQSARLVNPDEGRYDSCQAGVSWYIYRNSAVMSLGFLPSVVVYDHLVSTKDRIYMRVITIIDADWVPNLVTPLFHALKSRADVKRIADTGALKEEKKKMKKVLVILKRA